MDNNQFKLPLGSAVFRISLTSSVPVSIQRLCILTHMDKVLWDGTVLLVSSYGCQHILSLLVHAISVPSTVPPV